LFAFSATLLTVFLIFAEKIGFRGDGGMMLGGLIYFFPMKAIYKDKSPLLLTIICACWIYTLGIFSIAFQIAGILFSGTPVGTLLTITILYFLTLIPFRRKEVDIKNYRSALYAFRHIFVRFYSEPC
jgi:hypothetical protein